MFTGLMNGWALILLSIPIAIAIALILMVIIRFTAGCFIYILIALVVLSLVGLGIYMWTQPVGSSVGTSSLFQSSTVKVIAACLCFLFAIAIVIFFCCFKSRIALASAIV